MYKIAILGSENSHAENFVKIIKGGYGMGDGYPDFEVIGAYGFSPDASERLKGLGVPRIAENFDEFKGAIDAVMITARHGDNHLKFAMPYFKYGIPMFIDKPFTISEEEALMLARMAKENGCALYGGSVVKTLTDIKALKKAAASAIKHENNELGRIVSGSVSAPLIFMEGCGGFFFYSQHLAEMILEVFGPDIKSVQAFSKRDKAVVTVLCRYDDFDVTAHFGTEEYTVTLHTERKTIYKSIDIFTDGFEREFEAFAKTVRYNRMEISFDRLIRPVFVLNAINRSLESGKEEKIHNFEF